MEDATMTALSTAIKSASLTRVQNILLLLCKTSDMAAKLVAKELLVDANNPAVERAPPSKRAKKSGDAKVQRYLICNNANCNKEFDTMSNEMGDCVTHPGQLEPDDESDFWADHDEMTHGPVDTQDNRKHFPEGFLWDCCEKDGTERGCRVSAHNAVGLKFSHCEESDISSESSDTESSDIESETEGSSQPVVVAKPLATNAAIPSPSLKRKRR